MSFELYQITLSLAILMLAIEMFSGTFIFFGFAIGLTVVAIIHFVTREFAFGRDCSIFAITSLCSFLILRNIFKHKDDSRDAKDDVNHY